MNRFMEDVANCAGAGTETASSVYVPCFQLTRGQSPPIAANGGLSFMAFDSITDGSVSRSSFHSVRIDPTAPADAPCRRNVVVRSCVFFS